VKEVEHPILDSSQSHPKLIDLIPKKICLWPTQFMPLVKAPALPVEYQAGIGYNTAAHHRIKYQITLIRKIIAYSSTWIAARRVDGYFGCTDLS